MDSSSILVLLDILEYFGFKFSTSHEPLTVNDFNFKRVKKALGNSIVPTVTFTTHT